MKTTAMLLAAALALGVAGQASAQVIRDHRRPAARQPIHRPTRPQVIHHHHRHGGPRHVNQQYRYGRGGGYYWVNGLWVYDTPVGTPISDPLYFRYPGVAPPRGPIEIVYDASGNYMWIAGYWEWYRGRWIWVDGYWEPVRAGYYYRPGHWQWHSNRWVRNRGYWSRLPRDHRQYRVIRRDVRVNERVPARRAYDRY